MNRVCPTCGYSETAGPPHDNQWVDCPDEWHDRAYDTCPRCGSSDNVLRAFAPNQLACTYADCDPWHDPWHH